MMNFNARQGFSILEVIIAMGIVASVVTLLLMMQSSLLQRTKALSDRVERMLLLRPFLQESRQKTAHNKQEASYEKEVSALQTKLMYRRTRPPENSVLHTAKHVYLETVLASWQSGGTVLTESLVTTTYIPPTLNKEKS